MDIHALDSGAQMRRCCRRSHAEFGLGIPPASRQAEPVTDNDTYWPQGFTEELIDELVAAVPANPDGAFEFAKFEEMSRRAAVEITCRPDR